MAVLVFGAAGYTGRLVVEALHRRGVPMVLAGRSRERLEAVARGLGNPEIRIADPTRPETLRGLFTGVGCVANTVGPFRLLGMPVVREAVAQGVHYVDTTGEQTYQLDVLQQMGPAAADAGVTVITGQAYEYAVSYCGATILNDRHGPLTSADAFYLVRGAQASRGTKKSAIGMLQETFLTFHGKSRVPRELPITPGSVSLPGERRTYSTVPFPGGDEILLPGEITSLEHYSCNLVLPAGSARSFALLEWAMPVLRPILKAGAGDILTRRIDATDHPSAEKRASAVWTVAVRGHGPAGERWFRADGKDAYAITGEICALGAAWLAEGRGRLAGVVSTGAAFNPEHFLNELGGAGLRWECTLP